MNTNQAAVLDRTGAADKRGPDPRAVRRCRCGQDLDVCSRTHCPRCGRTLPHG